MAQNTDIVPVSGNQSLATVSEQQYPVLTFDPEDLSALVQENLGTGMAPKLQRISWPTGGNLSFNMETDEGPKSVSELRGIVLYHTTNRTFWQETFEKSGGGAQPDCQSPDGIMGFGVPADPLYTQQAHPMLHVRSPEQGYACKSCPLSKFHDDERPRCRQTHPLFMLLESADPEDVNLLPVVVSIPPSSLKKIDEYIGRLLNRGMSYKRAITELSLERLTGGPGGKIAYSGAVIRRVGVMNQEQLARVRAYSEMLQPLFDRFANVAVDVEIPDQEFVEASAQPV